MIDEETGAANTSVGVAVPAAGSGQRMGGVRKAFMELDGRPLLRHALTPFLDDARVSDIVVAVDEELFDDIPVWLAELAPRVRVVRGGDTRAESVRRALSALPDTLAVLAIHDAARPLVTSDVVSRCVDRALSGVGGVAGSPAVDTIKEVEDGVIVGSPDRARLWHAHTPQVFPAAILRAAYASGVDATDDAALVAAAGGIVECVDDGGWNLKVTRPSDIAVAEVLLRTRGGAP
ncbi:MAG: 2-C-methyl-D-erythritol 4-phosphate cytidylyltransferase [Gemmatimonadota bacterium]